MRLDQESPVVAFDASGLPTGSTFRVSARVETS